MSEYDKEKMSHAWTPIAFKRTNDKKWQEKSENIIDQARKDFDDGKIDMVQQKSADGTTYLLIKRAADMFNKPVKRKPYFKKASERRPYFKKGK